MGEENEIKTKICSKCGRELPMSSEYFYKKCDTKDGLTTKCKECIKEKDNSYESIEEWYKSRTNKFKTKWKFEDIKWMYDNYLNINKQELLNYFDNKVSYKALTSIIYRWDIKKTEKNDNWSKEDIQFLKENYPHMEQSKLEKRFEDRTWHSIKTKASRLNIHRDEETLFKIKSESHIGYKFSEDRKRELSRKNRGSNNRNWRGGISPIVPYFRGILYEWKMDSLKQYDYKCAFTKENNGDLEIHHINKNFNEIMYETFETLSLEKYDDMTEYSNEELEKINKTFLELHYKYGLGIPLNKIIHRLFHSIYGNADNTEEQFKEFKEKYCNGEYEEAMHIMEQNSKLLKPKTQPRDKHHKYKKLNKEEVIEIKKYINKGMPDRYIAKEFKVSEVAIYNIRTNRTWKEVS